MANLIFDKVQIEATIDKIVDRTMRMDMTWDWPCGVAYYGICEAYEVTKNERYLQLVKDRVDEYIELGLPRWTVNTCSMGHCLITLYQHTGDEKYLNIAKSKVEYLEKEALRFGDHVLQHTVSVNNDFPEQAWADTLFMAGFFLLRMGVLLKDEQLIDDALNQYYWHIKYLQDPESGLYYHGYNNITGDHMSGIKWGRANAWAAYTMSQVGIRLPQCYLYPKFLDVVGSLTDDGRQSGVVNSLNGHGVEALGNDGVDLVDLGGSVLLGIKDLVGPAPLVTLFLDDGLVQLVPLVVLGEGDGDLEALCRSSSFGSLRSFGGLSGGGGFGLSRLRLRSTGREGENHDRGEKQCDDFFHCRIPP